MKQIEVQHPKPLISVIIPTLNGAELLANCLKSFVETETQFQHEILVVDDGSKDEEKKN